MITVDDCIGELESLKRTAQAENHPEFSKGIVIGLSVAMDHLRAMKARRPPSPGEVEREAEHVASQLEDYEKARELAGAREGEPLSIALERLVEAKNDWKNGFEFGVSWLANGLRPTVQETLRRIGRAEGRSKKGKR